MKKALLFLISLFAGIGIFIWIGRFVGWREIRNAFSVFSGWQGLIILGLTLLAAAAGTKKWEEILRGEGTNLSFWELLKPYLAGFAIMFFAPIFFLAGEMIRAYFLKEKMSVSWSKGVFSVLIDRISEWTVNLIVIFLGGFFFLYRIGRPPIHLAIIFGAAFLFFFSLIFYFYFKTIKRESIVGFFLKLFGLERFNSGNSVLKFEREIFDFFRLENITMWKTFFFSFLKALAMYFRAWFLILFLGKNLSCLFALPILSFTYLAAMIPIPAVLGSHEAIQVFAFGSLGLGAPAATAFTMIIRAADILVALIGTAALFQLGIGILKKYLR